MILPNGFLYHGCSHVAKRPSLRKYSLSAMLLVIGAGYQNCSISTEFFTYNMRGSRNFRQGGGGGGVQVSLTKISSDKAFFFIFFFFFFFSPQLILQKSTCQIQRNISFFKVPEGVQPFAGGSNFFQGGGGVQLLIPYRNPYNL